MVNFYERLAGYYDTIFPLTEDEVRFVREQFRKRRKDILDVGCATGNLALALERYNHKVTGVDNDPVMIRRAREKALAVSSGVAFYEKDLGGENPMFPSHEFDGIACIGNTLVHLRSEKAINDAVGNLVVMLKKGGVLVLQIVNYDRILGGHINSLPPIDREGVSFLRHYRWDEDAKSLIFRVSLILKKSGETLESETTLYPLRFEQLGRIVKGHGLKHIHYFGNYKQERYDKNSYSLIVVAHR